jgi:hypothetical protein
MNKQQHKELFVLIEQYGSACEAMGHGWGSYWPSSDTLLLQIKDKLEALESLKTPLEAPEKQSQAVGSQEVKDALREAFLMGQNYWADADSESWTANKRSDLTLQKFRDFSEEFSSKFN